MGLCLRSVEYTEKARIATYFTLEKGRVDAILPQARGTKSRQAGATEAGHVFRLHLKPPRGSANLSRLEQYEVLLAFSPPATLYIEACHALFQTLEVLAALMQAFQEEDGKRPQVLVRYQAMLSLWHHAQGADDVLWPMLWFWQGLLHSSGLIPSWGWDATTHTALPFPLKEGQLYYDSERGGLTQTGDGTTAFRVSRGVYSTLRMLEHAQAMPLHELPDLPCPPLQTLEHTLSFYIALLNQHHIHLKSHPM
jgi:recombinational DNA repair protein (RecF pathway)